MKLFSKYFKGMLAAAVVTAGGALPAMAQEAEAPDPKISASLGVDYNTHFISYGYDVWAGGDDWDRGTLNPWAEVAMDFGSFNLFVGTWWDVNDMAAPSIGGQLQEVDVWYGLGFDVDKWNFAFVYQDWIYGSDVEKVFDISVGYDDSELLGEWAMSPTFKAHKVIEPGASSGIKGNGWAYVFGVSPGFTLVESETTPIDLSFPVEVAFGDSEFYGESGFGYASVGVMAGMPLTFVPAEYGAWAVSGGVKYYHTDADATGNPEEDFLTGTVGISVAF